MKVEREIIDIWIAKKETGDYQRISDFGKKLPNKIVKSYKTIASAFQTGECDEDTYMLINQFFIDRARRRQLINDDIISELGDNK